MIQSMLISFISNLVPMNKIKVGMTQSPNIKQVRSKVRKSIRSIKSSKNFTISVLAEIYSNSDKHNFIFPM